MMVQKNNYRDISGVERAMFLLAPSQLQQQSSNGLNGSGSARPNGLPNSNQLQNGHPNNGHPVTYPHGPGTSAGIKVESEEIDIQVSSFLCV